MTLPTLIATFLLALGVAGPQPAATDARQESSPELFATWLSDARDSSPGDAAQSDALSDDIQTFQDLLETSLLARPAELESAARRLEDSGLTARITQIGSQRFVFLGPGERHLDSALLLRVGPVAHEVAIQAPHSFHDLSTGDAALHAFLNHDVRALCINTTHRHHHSDVTHDPDSFFFQATSAFLDTLEGSRIVQLHGFAHEGLSDAGIEIVVSNGTRVPTKSGAAVARSLAHAFETRHALYGTDTNEYGATRNPVGHLLRNTPDRFIHIELSRDIRESWAAVDPTLF